MRLFWYLAGRLNETRATRAERHARIFKRRARKYFSRLGL